MTLGYNTNGFAHHRLSDAVEIIAELGYGGVALTPDVHHLDPTESTPEQTDEVHRTLAVCGLACVLETGSRFAPDARRKHWPTLLTADPNHRIRRHSFLVSAIQTAARLGAGVVSFWSGNHDGDVGQEQLMDTLARQCRWLADVAAKHSVRLAFEPEPGMFIDTMPKFAELHARVNHPAFGLTLDVGHLVCMNETPASDHIRRWKAWLWNVHLDDMRPGVHDHLMFGDGAVDFADVFAGLRAIGYQGMASVELSRHSHDAVNTARKSFEFLSRL